MASLINKNLSIINFMRFLVFFFLCTLSSQVLATEAMSGDTIKQDDGTVIRLSGIRADSDIAKATLQKLVDGQTLILENKNTDRYGRMTADVYCTKHKDRLWLQGEMLRQGMAFVYPPTGGESHLDEMLKAEQEARHEKRGLWNEGAHADLPADDPAKIKYGHYAFVVGKVAKAERVKNMVYLNFGADWRTDFTAAIAAHDLKAFRKVGIDPLEYRDKTIRVRGWAKRDFGPMITVTNPAQIEVLGEKPARP